MRATDKPIVGSLDDVKLVLAVLEALPTTPDPIRKLGDELERIRQNVVTPEGPFRGVQLEAATFGFMGMCALQAFQSLEVFNWNDFAELLLRKHQKYGAHPLRVWGGLGVVIRIHSKYERYINIKDDPTAMLLDEGALDTLQDILGYCVLGYIMMEA